MTNIKVTYGSIVRRLSISSTTTWSELENQFRNLFSIPQEIPIAVTYIDEDGDVITLSSDLELQEVLDNSSNNANTIKFALNIPNVNNLNNREISIDTVIDEEETSNLINGLSAIQIKESNNDSNNNNNNDNVISGFKHVTITDEVDDPLFNQQRETLGENSKNSTKSINVQQENNNSEGNGNQENSDDDEHEIIVIITRNPWSHRRRARFGGRNPYYYPCVGRFRYGCHPHPHPHPDPEQGHGGQGGQGHNHGGYNRSGYFRGHGCGRYSRRHHHHHQQMSPEDVIEKVNTLNSMGFVEGDLEGLVKRYNGNLEFVIEALLFNKQNEQNSEVSNEDVVRKENDEKDQPMEVEEESGPYVL